MHSEKIKNLLKEHILNILSRVDHELESATQNNKILYTFLILLFVISLVIRIHFAFILPIIREDALDYFLKAEEITQGDFTPRLAYGMGLPIWESIFIYLLGSGELIKDINLVKALSAVTGGLIFIPLVLLNIKLFNRKVMIISAVLFTFQPWLITSTADVYTEPLFTLTLLITFYFLLKSTDQKHYLFIAPIIASFSYWIRPNGILLLPIILIYTIIIRKDIPNWKNRYLAYMVLIFFIVSAPYLYLRWAEYGSATYYGQNSHPFAESYEEAFSPNYEPQTIFQFLSTHSPQYIIKREINGFIMTLDAAMSNMLIPMVGFAIIGLIYTFKRKCIFIHITYIIWIIMFSWIFTLFPTPRYFLPLVPLAIIIAAFAIFKVSEQNKLKSLTIFIILFFFVAISGVELVKSFYSFQEVADIQKDGLEWAEWICTNIEPDQKISMREGGDLIKFYCNRKIEAIPLYDNLSAIMIELHEKNTNYIVIGDGGGESPDWVRRPALNEIYFGESIPEYFELLYSNKDNDSKWEVKIFYINWSKFSKDV